MQLPLWIQFIFRNKNKLWKSITQCSTGMVNKSWFVFSLSSSSFRVAYYCLKWRDEFEKFLWSIRVISSVLSLNKIVSLFLMFWQNDTSYKFMLCSKFGTGRLKNLLSIWKEKGSYEQFKIAGNELMMMSLSWAYILFVIKWFSKALADWILGFDCWKHLNNELE